MPGGPVVFQPDVLPVAGFSTGFTAVSQTLLHLDSADLQYSGLAGHRFFSQPDGRDNVPAEHLHKHAALAIVKVVATCISPERPGFAGRNSTANTTFWLGPRSEKRPRNASEPGVVSRETRPWHPCRSKLFRRAARARIESTAGPASRRRKAAGRRVRMDQKPRRQRRGGE